mgnify:CR=1 FL=1
MPNLIIMHKDFPVKNVILLTIDALRYDRIGHVAGASSKSPTIDYLANNGISCTRTFSHGCPTQMAMPSMFTSSLPLDYGGYDDIKGRPNTLAEVFKEHGYDTIGFTNGGTTSSYFGYDRGFNQFNELFTLDAVWFSLRKLYFSYYFDMQSTGEYSDLVFYDKVSIHLENFFQYLFSNTENLQSLFSTKENTDKKINIELNNGLLTEKLTFEYNKFHDDSIKFINEKTNFLKLKSKRYNNEVSRIELINYLQEINLNERRISPLVSMCIWAEHNINNWFGTNIKLNNHSETLRRDIKMTDMMIETIKTNDNNPFFLWGHFMSVHDKVYNHNSVFQIPVLNSVTEKIIQKDSCRFYDLSIRAVDDMINKLTNVLKQKKIFDETLLVITSDHGHYAGVPNRGIGLGRMPLYDEFIHVPLIFYNPSFRNTTVDYLCDLMDIAPTILDLANISCPSVFKGKSVFSQNFDERKHVLLEHAGRGPCDLNNKPIRIGVRTKEHKLIISESIKNTNHNFSDNELYDLSQDAHEKTNLYFDPTYTSVKSELEQIAYDRLRELKKDLPERT